MLVKDADSNGRPKILCCHTMYYNKKMAAGPMEKIKIIKRWPLSVRLSTTVTYSTSRRVVVSSLFFTTNIIYVS